MMRSMTDSAPHSDILSGPNACRALAPNRRDSSLSRDGESRTTGAATGSLATLTISLILRDGIRRVGPIHHWTDSDCAAR
jgi:hypothetical protein